MNRYCRLVYPLIVVAASALAPATASAQIAEYLHQMGESYAGWSDDIQKSGCTLPVWHMGKPQRVFLVPPGAVQFGLEAGDYLIAIDKKRIPLESAELNAFMSAIPEDATVSVTVFRHGDFQVLSAECQPADRFAESVVKLADSLLQADPDGCLAALDEFEEYALGSISSSMTETRHRCQMVATPMEFQENQAGYLYVLTEKMIDEMKYFPWFPNVRGQIQDRIDTISSLGEDDLAATLTEKLDAATEFAENDEAPPEVL